MDVKLHILDTKLSSGMSPTGMKLWFPVIGPLHIGLRKWNKTSLCGSNWEDAFQPQGPGQKPEWICAFFSETPQLQEPCRECLAIIRDRERLAGKILEDRLDIGMVRG